MSKDPSGFLRKVARFVAHPTTDWAELDNPPTDATESQYAKTEIKAMIERKRRNDFVRKRELDMLRKIRREGLSPDHATALSGSSSLTPDSRLHNGTRSDMTVKAKIDAIEQQMVGSHIRHSERMPLAPASTHVRASLSSHDSALAVTTPDALRPSRPLSLRTDLPTGITPEAQVASTLGSPLDMPVMRSALPSHAAKVEAPPNTQSGVQVAELAHDAEMDEAVIAFANADFDQCERCLLALIQPGAIRHDHAESWLVLFDLYCTLDLPQKFENLALAYAQKFGLSAPQWFSFPKKVAAFMASGTTPLRDGTPSTLNSPLSALGDPLPDATLEGWVAPATIDHEAVSLLRVEVLQMPAPWTMDWSQVSDITAEGAGELGQLMQQWARDALQLRWMGVEPLLALLETLAPTGTRDTDPAYWMLKLDILRLCNRPTQFDEAAIDYCVTYELSPPSWEPTVCTVALSQDALHPNSRPLSRISEVSTSFIESQAYQESRPMQVAALHLSGQLVGDIGHILTALDAQLGQSVMLDIDCENLLRVDFIAAGDLLNWVLARRTEDRQVTFQDPHRLVALFFGAMGINEHARVRLRTH